jgi:hypothetical protein
MDAMDKTDAIGAANTTDEPTAESHVTAVDMTKPASALLERLPSARKAIACDTATRTFTTIDDPES